MVAVTYRHNLNIEYRILYMVWDIEHRTMGMCFFLVCELKEREKLHPTTFEKLGGGCT